MKIIINYHVNPQLAPTYNTLYYTSKQLLPHQIEYNVILLPQQ